MRNHLIPAFCKTSTIVFLLLATAFFGACAETHSSPFAPVVVDAGAAPTDERLDDPLLATPTEATVAAQQAKSTTVTPKKADSFAKMIGVGIHANFGGEWQDRFEEWHPMLGELGVRYVRTSLGTSNRARDILNTLHRRYKIQSNLVYTIQDKGILDPSKIEAQLKFARDEVGRNKIIAIEGPNEMSKTERPAPNGEWVTNPQWARDVRRFQRTLYDQTKEIFGDGMPVLAPTIWRRVESDFRQLRNIEDRADIANLHYYTGALKPTTYSIFEEPETESLAFALSLARINVPRAPVQITEFSYNTGRDGGESKFAVPATIQSKYTARSLADFYLRGVRRAYYFNLMDRSDRDNPEKFERGLIADGPRLRRKLVFFTVKNLVHIMDDRGENFTPRDFTYALDGNLTNVRHLVFQKRNGRYFIMLWLNANSYDRGTPKIPGRELRVTPRSVTLNVTSHKFSRAYFYYPTALPGNLRNEGAVPAGFVKRPRVLEVDVPDELMIIELIP